MGEHEIIKNTPSSSNEAAVLPTPVSEPDATVTPKMALAGVDPSKVEMPKAATISAPRIEIAETNTETIAAPKSEFGNIEAPRLAPQIDELRSSSGGDAAATDNAAPEPAEESASPYVKPIYGAGGFARAGSGARRDGGRAGRLRPCTARCHPRRRGGANGARAKPGPH